MDDYSRRAFLRTSLPGFLGIGLALPSITAFATRAMAFEGRVPEGAPIDWEAFLEAIAKEAARQHLDDWDEPAYVRRAETLARQFDLADPHLAAAIGKAKHGIGNGRIDFSQLEQHEDFQISFLQFEKGEQISHHDHPEITGVLLCAAGDIECWNYDELPDSPEPGHILLRQSAKAHLIKGNVSTLTSKEHNIHRLRARELTQLVDIFAPPYTPQRIQSSRWFEVDEDPWQGTGSAYLAKVK